jgi:hypothetical protein
MRTAYKHVVGIPEGQRPPWRRGRIILKLIIKKQHVKELNELNWLRIKSSVRFL